MENSKRQIVKIIKELCLENNIKLNFYCYDWIMHLSMEDNDTYIYGYQFQNNNSTSDLVCCDKSALSEILHCKGIPAVKHEFFMSPNDMYYIGVEGNWDRMTKLLKEYKTIVCKKNNGTGGHDVFKVTTQCELEKAASVIFRNSSMAIAPYYEIDFEYRIILLNGEAELIYSKERLFVIGNGKQTLEELCIEKYGTTKLIVQSEQNKNQVIEDSVMVRLNWKHNLAGGAIANIVTDQKIIEELSVLAKRAAKAIQINFASIDIIQANSEYKILEINSGIVMEKFSKQNEEYYTIAKGIYKKAIDICLA